jgi:hypothetical protein
LKLVVLRTATPAEPECEFQNELICVARFTQKPNGFWHISFSCQRAGLPVRQESNSGFGKCNTGTEDVKVKNANLRNFHKARPTGTRRMGPK